VQARLRGVKVEGLNEKIALSYIKGLLFTLIDKQDNVQGIAENIIEIVKAKPDADEEFLKTTILGEFADLVPLEKRGQAIRVSQKIIDYLSESD